MILFPWIYQDEWLMNGEISWWSLLGLIYWYNTMLINSLQHNWIDICVIRRVKLPGFKYERYVFTFGKWIIWNQVWIGGKGEEGEETLDAFKHIWHHLQGNWSQCGATGGFSAHRACDAERWWIIFCWPVKGFKQTLKWRVKEYASKLMWRHLNTLYEAQIPHSGNKGRGALL